MNRQERVALAKARADKAAAALAAFDKAAAERKAAATAFHDRWLAFAKRSRTAIANLAGDYVQTTLAEFRPELGYAKPRPTTAKQIGAALRGGAKISGNSIGYGASYSLTGLAPRIRLLDRGQIRAVAKAKARMDRAQAALNSATAGWKAAKKAAFESGTKMTTDDLVAALVKREHIRLDAVELPDGLADLSEWRRDNLVKEAEQAGIHLAATRKGEECPCYSCVAERREAAEKKAEAERIAALPKVSATCPDHGKRRMGSERIHHFVDRDKTYGLERSGWWDDFPVLRCPAGHALVDTRQIAKDVKARAKARRVAERHAKAKALFERHAAEKGAKLPPPAAGETIAFKCPGCGEVNDHAETYQADDEDPASEVLVQCGGCGSEMLADGVARLALEQEAA